MVPCAEGWALSQDATKRVGVGARAAPIAVKVPTKSHSGLPVGQLTGRSPHELAYATLVFETRGKAFESDLAFEPLKNEQKVPL